MSFEFKLPEVGEGVVEGEIVKWLVSPGDFVTVEQPLVEVMTDKATVVIPSPTAGVIVTRHGEEGDSVKVHAPLVTIDDSSAASAKAPSPSGAGTGASTGSPASGPAAPSSGKSAEAKAPPKSPSAKAVAKAVAKAPARKTVTGAAAATPTVLGHSASRVGTAAVAATPVVPAHAPNNGSPRSRASGGGVAEKVLAAPATRRLARELGVDITQVPGSGPAGRVTSDDVVRLSVLPGAASALPTPAPLYGGAVEHEAEASLPRPSPVVGAGVSLAPFTDEDEIIPVRGLRKRIWESMTQSAFTAAHFTFVEECDATDLVALRARLNARLEATEPKLTYLPFIIKAVIAALRRFPMLNGHVDDEQRTFVRRSDFHIGIAVASDRGLVVPVVRHADRRSLVDLSREILRLSEAVRTSQIRSEDLGGSTFTITSLGKDGGILATPIINYPEVAIMGVHKLKKRPMVIEGPDGDQVSIRQVMNLSLSFDHRLIDGHVGAAFANTAIALLEQPDRLIMEMT
ncbi:MAG: 2-oxo acid dehydrogenase subunit E2 [Deltaproteobacteria bacterium]|nr:2-oxo acid dehydrogenase subunit E2 [Deltaproteobacteria bacterium]